MQRGWFYAPELLKTVRETTYRIEKVIRQKTLRGKKMFFVKFLGIVRPQWISEDDFV